jgi:hypothetical protein
LPRAVCTRPYSANRRCTRRTVSECQGLSVQNLRQRSAAVAHKTVDQCPALGRHGSPGRFAVQLARVFPQPRGLGLAGTVAVVAPPVLTLGFPSGQGLFLSVAFMPAAANKRRRAWAREQAFGALQQDGFGPLG